MGKAPKYKILCSKVTVLLPHCHIKILGFMCPFFLRVFSIALCVIVKRIGVEEQKEGVRPLKISCLFGAMFFLDQRLCVYVVFAPLSLLISLISISQPTSNEIMGIKFKVSNKEGS